MFRKYPSLENAHNVTTDYLDLDMQVCVMEKVDGSNFSINWEGDFFSRNKKVDPTWNSLKSLVPEKLLKKLEGTRIHLYGEVFSSKILKRIPYGDTKVRFFDVSRWAKCTS